MKFSLVTLVAALAVANGMELTPDTWDSATAGKTVFLKFFAPWCGHCKKMAPDYNKLMKDFEGSATQLVAEVDCTTEGKPLCDANGVRGFPTLKYGDPSALEDYSGGRDYASLKAFCDENLKPMCSPANIDLCDDDKKAEIEKFMAMDAAELGKLISEKETEQEKVEAEFKEFVGDLQAKYQKAMSDKDEKLAEIKNSGLGLMKSVLATSGKGTKSEL